MHLGALAKRFVFMKEREVIPLHMLPGQIREMCHHLQERVRPTALLACILWLPLVVQTQRNGYPASTRNSNGLDYNAHLLLKSLNAMTSNSWKET